MFLYIRKSYNLKRIVVRESPWYKIEQVNNKVETFMSKHMCPKKMYMYKHIWYNVSNVL